MISAIEHGSYIKVAPQYKFIEYNITLKRDILVHSISFNNNNAFYFRPKLV